MVSITDETYYRYLGPPQPRFVVRGRHTDGAMVCEAFSTRRAAERFRDMAQAKRGCRAQDRQEAEFAGDVKGILDAGSRLYFSAGRTYLGLVRAMEGGYGIQLAGMKAPILSRSWVRVAAFIEPATRVTDKEPC